MTDLGRACCVVRRWFFFIKKNTCESSKKFLDVFFWLAGKFTSKFRKASWRVVLLCCCSVWKIFPHVALCFFGEVWKTWFGLHLGWRMVIFWWFVVDLIDVYMKNVSFVTCLFLACSFDRDLLVWMGSHLHCGSPTATSMPQICKGTPERKTIVVNDLVTRTSPQKVAEEGKL